VTQSHIPQDLNLHLKRGVPDFLQAVTAGTLNALTLKRTAAFSPRKFSNLHQFISETTV
jgi:hypothetical protein